MKITTWLREAKEVQDDYWVGMSALWSVLLTVSAEVFHVCAAVNY